MTFAEWFFVVGLVMFARAIRADAAALIVIIMVLLAGTLLAGKGLYEIMMLALRLVAG